MYCRIDIRGRKTWVDGDNAHNKRPKEPIIIHLLRDGEVYKTAQVDPFGNGRYEFRCMPVWKNSKEKYNYQIDEPIVPEGYRREISGFNVTNTLSDIDTLLLKRATDIVTDYAAAPNTWPLHGDTAPDLFMRDKILIFPEPAPVKVKWATGIRTVAYFASGGYDITATYTDGISAGNGDYTVYALFSSGYEIAVTIKIDNIRDGSAAKPYLLIDYATAAALEPRIEGIGQFTLDFMQGGGVKQTLNYEIFQDIAMKDRTWTPLGAPTAEGFTGSLYGNGNDITDMSVTYPQGNIYSGMFARVADGGRIENLGLKNFVIPNTTTQAAGFAGLVGSHNGATTVLKDLHFSGAVTSTTSAAGIAAFVSVSNGSVLIEGCTADAVISGSTAGGIAATSSITASAGIVTVKDCYASGSVAGTVNTAGILGNSSVAGSGQFKIENCANAMSVQSAAAAGGILGGGSTASGGSVSACHNAGSVEGVSFAGGIIGDFTGSSATNIMTISDCYNSAKITVNGKTTSYVGGIIGAVYSNIRIKNCYNTGDVSATASGAQNNVGGISGNYGLVDNCAAIDASCSSPQSGIARISQSKTLAAQSVLNNNVAFENMQVLIAGVQKTPLDEGSTATDGARVTAAVFKTQNFYETVLGWDFAGVWSFGNGAYTLPVLRAIPVTRQPAVLPSHL